MNMQTSMNFTKTKEKDRYSTVIILDGLEDPHNLGSILRTADASGVDAVIIPKRRSVVNTDRCQSFYRSDSACSGHKSY